RASCVREKSSFNLGPLIILCFFKSITTLGCVHAIIPLDCQRVCQLCGVVTWVGWVWGEGTSLGLWQFFSLKVICCIASLVLGDTTLVLGVYKWVAPLVLLGTNGVKVIKEGVVNGVIRGYGLGV
ncbi:hypothetical protein Tco_0998513, partial [Tanacetum coccineum]